MKIEYYMTKDDVKSANWSAARMYLSPHEWTWTQKECEDMAKYILSQNKELHNLQKVKNSIVYRIYNYLFGCRCIND